MNHIFRCFCIIFMFLFITSCKVKRFIKGTFPQGDNMEIYKTTIDQYKKTLRLYDYFELKSEFNVLWLSDNMKTAYSKILARRQGKDPVAERSILRRQLEENDSYISFYVLSLKSVNLGRNDSEWSTYLEIDGKKYQPKKVKKIELLPEYEDFFGTDLSKYKKPYIVRFDAKDWEENQIITSKTKQIKLIFSSSSLKGAVEWELEVYGSAESKPIDVEPEEKELEDEDLKEDLVDKEVDQEKNN